MYDYRMKKYDGVRLHHICTIYKSIMDLNDFEDLIQNHGRPFILKRSRIYEVPSQWPRSKSYRVKGYLFYLAILTSHIKVTVISY